MSFNLGPRLAISILCVALVAAGATAILRERLFPTLHTEQWKGHISGLNLKDYRLTGTRNGAHNGREFETIRYELGMNRVTIQTIWPIEEDTANQRISTEIEETLHAFDSFTAPYPGVISRTVECPKDAYPQVKTITLDGGSLKYMNAFATTNYTIGICNQRDGSLNASYIYIFCQKSKSLTLVTAYNTQPQSQFMKPLVQCSNPRAVQ